LRAVACDQTEGWRHASPTERPQVEMSGEAVCVDVKRRSVQSESYSRHIDMRWCELLREITDQMYDVRV
jgi:hypothetical protein